MLGDRAGVCTEPAQRGLSAHFPLPPPLPLPLRLLTTVTLGSQGPSVLGAPPQPCVLFRPPWESLPGSQLVHPGAEPTEHAGAGWVSGGC